MKRFISPLILFLAGCALIAWFIDPLEINNLALAYRQQDEGFRIFKEGFDVISFFFKAFGGAGFIVSAVIYFLIGEYSKASGLSDARDTIASLKNSKELAQKSAHDAAIHAKAELADEFKQAEQIKLDAHRKLQQAESLQHNADKKVQAMANEAKKRMRSSEVEAQSANELKQREGIKKGNAADAMQRHKRKVDSLKNDYSKLVEFAKKYHPKQFQ